jgi:ABC-type transporter Mla MlaB component
VTASIAASLALDEGTLQIKGAVNFYTLESLIAQLNACVAAPVHSWNCSGLAQLDSAAAAFLLALLKWREKTEQPLRLQHWPQSLYDLLALYAIEAWVDWEESPAPEKPQT